MRIIIYVDSDTGEIFYYVPDTEAGEAVLIEPRIKKKKWETEEKDKRTH